VVKAMKKRKKSSLTWRCSQHPGEAAPRDGELRQGGAEPVIAKISLERLTEMIGTTRSRVSTFMNKFRELGFVNYNRDLEVQNSLLNVVLHDHPRLRTRAQTEE
jgi:hypothetical protein